jgi:hypothetical protein
MNFPLYEIYFVCNSMKKGEFCKVFGLLPIHLVKTTGQDDM